MLTSRPTETMTGMRRRLFVTGRVGPYELVREIARAPAVTLAEGRDQDDNLWLLQLVRCRGVLGEEERVERHRHEKLLAQKTAEMVSASEVIVSAHGGADIEHGERVLFWAFPYTDLQFVHERIDERPFSAAELARLGAHLAERLAARHAWGRTDPLLGEHVVRLLPSGKPEVFGVPLTVPMEWLAPSMQPPRLAPEEKKTEERRPGGDVWRLGKLLLALAERTPEAGPEMRACFEALADDDPLKRVPSAGRAAELLERLTGSHRTATPVAPSLNGRRNVFEKLLATKHTDWTDSTSPEAPRASGSAEIVQLPDPRAASSWEIPTLTPRAPTPEPVKAAQVAAPTPPPVKPFDTDKEVDVDTVRAEAYLKEHGIEIAHESEAITRKSEPQTPVPEGRAVLIDRSDDKPIEVPLRERAIDPAEKVLDERTEPRDAPTMRLEERTQRELPTMRLDDRTAQRELPTMRLDDRTAQREGTATRLDDRTAQREGTATRSDERASQHEAAADERSAQLETSLRSDERGAARDAPTMRLETPKDPPVPAELPPPSVSADTIEAPAPKTTVSDPSISAAAVPDTVVEPVMVPEIVSPSLRVIEATVPQRTERTEPATPAFAIPLISAETEATLPEAEPAEKKTNGHHLDPLAAAWQQPVLPAGESPWSEVVQPRGTHHRDRGGFPGFDQDLPVPARVERRSSFETAPTSPAFAPLPVVPEYKEVPTSEIEVEIAAALKSFDKKKIISGVLVALVIFGLFALLSRSGRSPSDQGLLIATPSNVVTLDSDPRGATVVSEVDGTVLGKTPLELLVAPNAPAPVFLIAEGREPLRLALPDRGGITAKLVKIEQAECVVKLLVPGDIELEGIEADIGSNAERRIAGAAVVRATPGQRLRGARVVMCGEKEQELHLSKKPAPVAVRVTAPDGAAAYLNGDPIGTVPAVGRTSAAFARVRIDDQNGSSEELLVATPSEIEVRMPAARAKPIPHVTAGDEEEPQRVEEEVKAPVEESMAPDAGNVPAAKPKLTRAQRVARAKHLLKQGTKHLSGGRIQKAKDSLIECVEVDPAAAECHKTLGMMYRRARTTYKAREHFNRYLELMPNAPDADRVRKMLEQ